MEINRCSTGHNVPEPTGQVQDIVDVHKALKGCLLLTLSLVLV